ncbi:MAG: nucleoside 2-deoxyribosyltransferase domain-containing protein [Methanosarcinaceae archaeon]|nr:nucleoside 2-deoxyribosyltransferase domain-containing protein [Methanosarcinaceae archaeon]
MTQKKTIYLAGPLFSEAEQDFNRKLRDILVKKGYSVFLPQEDSNDTTNMRHAHKKEHVFDKNCKAIDNSDIIVAVLDGGSDVDSGTAWELGYAYAKGKLVMGLKTDFRTLGSEGTVNLMIEVSLEVLVSDIDGLLKALGKYQ